MGRSAFALHHAKGRGVVGFFHPTAGDRRALSREFPRNWDPGGLDSKMPMKIYKRSDKLKLDTEGVETGHGKTYSEKDVGKLDRGVSLR